MAINNQSGIVVRADEATVRFSELLLRIERGEEITITRDGTPVARVVPIKRQQSPAGRRVALERWVGLRAGLRLGEIKMKNLIEEVRH
jgi:prevent-host-death family protein